MPAFPSEWALVSPLPALRCFAAGLATEQNTMVRWVWAGCSTGTFTRAGTKHQWAGLSWESENRMSLPRALAVQVHLTAFLLASRHFLG